MLFIRNRSPIIHSYHFLDSDILRTGSSVIYPGFKLNNSFDPGPHMGIVCCKAFKVISFVNRLSKDLKLDLLIKTVFFTFVWPIMEYGVVVWTSYTTSDFQ